MSEIKETAETRQYAALARLSMALNSPAVEGETIEMALVEYAISKIEERDYFHEAWEAEQEKNGKLQDQLDGLWRRIRRLYRDVKFEMGE